MTPFLLKLSFVFAIAAHGADLASTENCLGRGVCRELNPWLARFDQPGAFGAAKMGVAGVSEVWLYDFSKEHSKIVFWTNLAIGASFTSVAIHNAKVTR